MRYLIWFCFCFSVLALPPPSSITNLHDVALWEYQSKVEHQTKAEEFLKQGMDINGKNSKGQTPLHIASHYNNQDMVRFFLEKGANPNVQDRNGRTALHYAIMEESKDAVRMLMAAGANPGLRDKKGRVPAQHTKDPEILKTLVQGALARQSLGGGLNSLKLQTEAGACLDCVDDEKGTAVDVERLNKRVCEQMMKRKECKNTPDLLKNDCQKDLASMVDKSILEDVVLPVSCVGGGLVAGGFAGLVAMGKMSSMVPGSAASWFASMGLGFVMAISGMTAMYVANLYEKAVKKTYREARKLSWHKTFIYNREMMEGLARDRMYSFIGGKLHDILYGDNLHCYSRIARMVRVCGVLGGLSSASIIGGGLSGLGAGQIGAAGVAATTTGADMIAVTSILAGSGGGGVAGSIGAASTLDYKQELNRVLQEEYNKTRQEVLQQIQANQTESATENVDRLLKEAATQ